MLYNKKPASSKLNAQISTLARSSASSTRVMSLISPREINSNRIHKDQDAHTCLSFWMQITGRPDRQKIIDGGALHLFSRCAPPMNSFHAHTGAAWSICFIYPRAAGETINASSRRSFGRRAYKKAECSLYMWIWFTSLLFSRAAYSPTRYHLNNAYKERRSRAKYVHNHLDPSHAAENAFTLSSPAVISRRERAQNLLRGGIWIFSWNLWLAR